MKNLCVNCSAIYLSTKVAASTLHLAAAKRLDSSKFISLMASSPMSACPELAHAIRQRNEKIPIAVVTGWGEAVGSDEQKEAGVEWVVAKPFHAEKIAE